jgi:phage terminase small subunit
MPGPPPKPTALKLLAGNPGKRKINREEPQPPAGAEMPKWMEGDPILVTEWKRHAPRLLKLGLLTEVDDDALATLCVLSIRLREQVGGMAATSTIIDTSKELRALWARFGMTPADRSRVKLPAKAEEKDPLAEFEMRSGGKR